MGGWRAVPTESSWQANAKTLSSPWAGNTSHVIRFLITLLDRHRNLVGSRSVSEMSRAKRLDFLAARYGKIVQQIDRSAIEHFAQFEEGLVRRRYVSTIFRSTCS